MKKLLFITLVNIFLIGCDAKPIDYSKHTHKSSYVRAGSTQTGRLSKSTQGGELVSPVERLRTG